MSKAMPSGALLSLQNVLFEHPALHGTAVTMGRTHLLSLAGALEVSEIFMCLGLTVQQLG